LPKAGESTQVPPTSRPPSEPVATDQRSGLDPIVGPIRVSLADQAQAEAGTEAEDRPSTAEQAVPWLIGVILLLAGMVIVLLALIFTGDGSLGGAGTGAPSDSALAAIPSADLVRSVMPTPTSTPTPTRTPTPTSSAEATAEPSAEAIAEPTPAPDSVPDYGALEMVYLGRSEARAPIYLLRRDFTADEEPRILARDATLDVRRYAWSPDGTVGAGLLADALVSIQPGHEKRRLADGITTITFGDDAKTLYAVRVKPDGKSDVATVLAIDFASGESRELGSARYARPTIGEEAPLAEAQLSDDGGPVRLYWVEDGTLRLWARGAGTWQIDPEGGETTELETDARPTLLAPDGEQRITSDFEDGATTLALVDADGEALETTNVTGRVSHLRWAPDGQRVVFTVGVSTPGGGVLQDLHLWDLNPEKPTKITATGAAFGAEWLGAKPLWRN